MLTTASARAVLPPRFAGRSAGPSTVDKAIPPANIAEASLAARIRGNVMDHLRHHNPVSPRRVPTRASGPSRAMTELGRRPERRLTELWHFGGVRGRGAQASHDAAPIPARAMDSGGVPWQG